jgi:hypothetical protein
MQSDSSVLKRTLVSGTVSGLAGALAAAFAGRRETASYSAPINATSHILWGDEAAHHGNPSIKYTATGFLLNHAAAVMWAAVYEKWVEPTVARWFSRQPNLAPLVVVGSAAAVSAGAYVTDYYLVPRRFTPGYEKRLGGQSMVLIYGALALGLAASTLLLERNSD